MARFSKFKICFAFKLNFNGGQFYKEINQKLNGNNKVAEEIDRGESWNLKLKISSICIQKQKLNKNKNSEKSFWQL